MTDIALTDKCLAEFEFIVQDLPMLPTLSAENSNGKIDIWYLPRDISQSTFNGHNGSNICSMISILISYLYSKKRLQMPETSIIPFEVLELVSGCIEFGNRMYLSIEEAVRLLLFSNMATAEPLPVKLNDDQELQPWSKLLGH